MTDQEYALCIYTQAYNRRKDFDARDVNVRWILEAIDNSLSPQERTALEIYYRHGKTYKQAGEDMGGLSGARVSKLVKKAILKLRHQSLMRNMSVANIIEDRNKYKQELEYTKKQLEEANRRLAEAGKLGALLQALSPNATTDTLETSIYHMSLPTRALNALERAGIQTLESLLERKTYTELMKIRNFGHSSADLVIAAVRELGFSGWADSMEAGRRRDDG